MTSKMNESKKQNQIPDNRIADLVPDLRNILLENHNISIPERNNEFLARCIRVKDGNLEKGVKLVLVFPKMFSEVMKWNISTVPSYYATDCYDLFGLFPLAVRDSENRRIFIGQLNEWDTNKLTFNEVLWACGILLEYAVSHNLEDQRNGFVVVIDCTGFSRNHVFAVKHRSLLTMVKYVQNGAVGRIKGCHVINHPRPISLIYTALKPFLKAKMVKRIHFHESQSSLISKLDVDSQFLPKFLGGTSEIEECVDKQFMIDLINSDAFFQDMFKYGYPTK